MFTLILLTLCTVNNNLSCEVGVLPDFQPTEYLFKTYADKGPERWKIFAWAVRDAMAKVGGFKSCDMTTRVQFAYYDYLTETKGCFDVANMPIEKIIEHAEYKAPVDKKK